MTSDIRLHPLPSVSMPSKGFADPFDDVPHPLCVVAADELRRYIETDPAMAHNPEEGKMLGVLVVESTTGEAAYLAAYSGLLDGRNDHPFFVPPVFDAQQPDGHFKTEERRISDINHAIERLTGDPHRLQLMQRLSDLQKEAEAWTGNHKRMMAEAKARRDNRRKEATTEAETEAMRNESRFMKAELKRQQRAFDLRHHVLQAELQTLDDDIRKLKKQRAERSEALQHWLFSRYVMCNGRGERADLHFIFSRHGGKTPPAGAGDCCAPKLLQYALLHGWRPVALAEFWMGRSPKGELRRHGNFYRPCRGKCKPILDFMLQGLDVRSSSPRHPFDLAPVIVYEDDAIVVVRKPSGLPSVPGTEGLPSVERWLDRHCLTDDGIRMVHRLDMDTSGLLVAAKNRETQRLLQALFERREVEKTYVALVEGTVSADKGTICLPLRPDPFDRPRQCVDPVDGKEAVTDYEVMERDDTTTRLHLKPHTGRTHQLRVHCAHPDGLNAPVKGDTLYGTPDQRLCLHACRLAFVHPLNGRHMTFADKAPF